MNDCNLQKFTDELCSIDKTAAKSTALRLFVVADNSVAKTESETRAIMLGGKRRIKSLLSITGTTYFD